MELHPIFRRYTELQEFVRILRHEVQQAQRPANEIILNDQDVMKMLTISKRKLQYLKSNGEIPYHLPGTGGRSYYLLSDILEWLEKSRVDNLESQLKIR